ncbi:NADP-dependent malic enzyme [Candidatus Saccharibacteria bacterium]|nr:NADP-dependent malic enzyme [Candidatus Saccharibacteria bacterium]
MNYDQLALDLHKQYGGKITLKLRDGSQLDRDKLSAYYTPGVAAVCREIAAHPDKMPVYTWTNNLVAVISDGSAVLGLGDIGPRASMPVMEGKALLFKHFANVDAVPIVLDVHEPDEIIAAVKAIAPSFGGINLEDISAPKCFEVEERLKNELDIPVMHDDQHGTAIVTLAGLINAENILGRDLNSSRAVFSGVGAAGVAIMRLLKEYAPGLTIHAVDSRGMISSGRDDLNPIKKQLLDEGTIAGDVSGTLTDAVKDADIFVGVSAPGILTPDMIKTMNSDPIIFALANPDPEIMPDVAKQAGAAIVATGRSDFPNQVNNALAFPGIFRGALDHGVKKITGEHKIAAAEAIAGLVENPTVNEIIPSVFAPNLVETVADVIR